MSALGSGGADPEITTATPLVIDASAVAAWLMPDETGEDLLRLTRWRTLRLAPWLFWAELRNILIVGERRGRLPAGAAEEFLEAVAGLGIALDARPAEARVMALARSRGLTVYDALYLELALRRGAELMTLDAALARAAMAEGVPLAGGAG